VSKREAFAISLRKKKKQRLLEIKREKLVAGIDQVLMLSEVDAIQDFGAKLQYLRTKIV